MSLIKRAMPMVGGGYIQDPSAIPPPSYTTGISAAGVSVNDHTAFTVMAFTACVQLISDAIMSLPINVYRHDNNNVPVKVDPQPKVISNPFGDLTRNEGIGQILVSLLTRGNAYIHIIARNNIGWATQLRILPPTQVETKFENGEIVYRDRLSRAKFNTNDIVHIRGLMLPGSLVGLAPVEYAARTLGISIATEEYGSRFFAQGSTVAGILTSEDELTVEEARTLKQDFMSWHSGIGNSHLPLVLPGGMKYENLTIPPDQAQFLLTREFQRSEVAMMFGVPPHMIGDTQKSTSWGSGIEQQEIGFITHTLMRWVSRIENAWDSKLLPNGNYMRFNFDSLLRTDVASRYAAYLQARTGGWLNNDEIRAMEDLPPIKGGDDYRQPMNAPTPKQGAAAKTGAGDEP